MEMNKHRCTFQRVKVLFVFHGIDGTPQIAVFDNDISHLGVSSYGALMYKLTEITTISLSGLLNWRKTKDHTDITTIQ